MHFRISSSTDLNSKHSLLKASKYHFNEAEDNPSPLDNY